LSIILFLFAAPERGNAQDEFEVLSDWLHYTDIENSLYHYIEQQGLNHLTRRSQTIEQLNSREDWENYQTTIRNVLRDIVGPFPEKTPLNAEVLGTVEKDDFLVQHVTFESQPKFNVTASLFTPTSLDGKRPALVFCSGHTSNSHRWPDYQRVILNFVKKGFIVLAFDPIGQGERLQYFDPKTAASRIGGPTDEHSYVSAQAIISGRSPAQYWIWDGIRAIDYLTTLDEVDASKIGILGQSGGGTQAAHIAAFDERITAAAPGNFITNYKRLLQSIGPQDGEQNFYHGLARGIDHADLLEVRAPKPLLIVATSRDFFPFQGTEETYDEVREAYKQLGNENNIDMVVSDVGHGYTKKNREAMYRFFQHHLNHPGSSEDLDVNYLTREELKVTRTGQVTTALDSKTVFDLNRETVEPLLNELQKSRSDLADHLEDTRSAAQNLSGYQPPTDVGKAIFLGRHQRSEYTIEQYFLEREGDYPIPFLVLKPQGENRKGAVIYLHPDGKQGNSSSRERMEWLVRQGYIVLAPDLVGTGEVGPGRFTGDSYIDNVSYNKWFGAMLVGQSITGIRAGDIVRLAQYLQEEEGVSGDSLGALAYGELTPALLHAAAFDSTIGRIALVEPLLSYKSLVMNEYYNTRFVSSAVAGALTEYDLVDLAATLAPRELLMVNVVDHNGIQLEDDHLREETGVIRSAYAQAAAEENINFRNWESYQSFEILFEGWLW
jgi:cephalosporin-C deacetylase-like acetyl esterase